MFDTISRKRIICNIAPHIYYKNVHLMKDCCLFPYLYAKKYNYELVIVTVKHGEYSYLENMPEIIMDFQNEVKDIMEWEKHCCEYIKEHAKNIDILFCFGLYYTYMRVVPLYKALNPDGKVILKMDANAAWMDRIPFEDQMYKNILENCDFISCECKKIKKLLSYKIPYKIEYVPNGLDYNMYPIKSEFKDKENTLLFVGRIGDEDKQNEVLLEAFAKVSDKIPSWKLKMVGGIEEGFTEYLDKYFDENPDMKKKIVFTGEIVDKQKLYNEYAKAKVFTLTSKKEGGTPNVFAEAAAHGCYMICSSIDTSDEVTNWGRNGSGFLIGDVDGLARQLLKVCSEPDAFFEKNYYEMKSYAYYYFNYDNIVKRMHYIMELN